MNLEELINQLFYTPAWWSYVLRIILVIFFAWLFLRIARIMTRHMANSARISARRGRRVRDERVETIQRLVNSFLTFIVIATAFIIILNMFVPTENLVWMAGLFAAAFGLGLMPLVRDFFTGVTFLFEDPFDVGEKIELHVSSEVQGIVEHVNLRTTSLRAPTGELYTIPNGEIRVIRNFSRGRFSIADIALTIAAADLEQTLAVLEPLGEEAVMELPNLLEPWQIISPDGHIGQTVELKLIAKARFGNAAEMRTRLLALVQHRLDEAGIILEM